MEELGRRSGGRALFKIRLVLASKTGAGTSSVANAVQPTVGELVPLDTPSGRKRLKLQAHFDVRGPTADVLLDFDACKSIVKAGNRASTTSSRCFSCRA